MSEERKGGVVEKTGETLTKTVKTSISIAEDLWREVKIAAIKRGLTFSEVVSAALRKWLELTEKEKEAKS
ncbi:MAG: hypothetical protein DRJ31_02845 [Candidatus Methanomethylicota archaeon]|uniref:Ribbon-helix-helix protein CopG domain-containing protein n=1 Tax=Thermoproteota archaeon TaxID=2056631 RepID=A0A497ERM3_9CREN|nr:MAG: hypothetical protein DRJ31_02845 [Candidatus Verstraetearchaeota archaeon]RLE52682.1 MAG: hypothetical protein DRJ33_03150 [Candidatus Verstraetearchaeota archaeon]